MFSQPKNIHELEERIKKDFALKIVKQLKEYFVEHQFDEWDDIYDDITNGYDDCCCKIILFEQLNITNIEQKHNEYERLKRCIEPPKIIQKQIPINISFKLPKHVEPNSIEYVTQQICRICGTIWGNKFGEQIADIFEKTVNEEQFDDMQSVKEDVEDIEESMILSEIMKQIKPHLNLFDEKEIKKIENKLHQIIMAPYLIKPDIENKQDEKDEKQSYVKIPKIEEIKRQIMQQFDRDIAPKVLAAFNTVVYEDGYDDVNTLKEDVQEIDDSTVLNCLESVEEMKDNYPKLFQNKIKLNNIILRILSDHKYIDIQSFVFNITKEDVEVAAKFLTKHCIKIYPHLLGVATKLKPSDLSDAPIESKNNSNNRRNSGRTAHVAGKALAIVKTIDCKNRQPIALWLLNLYSKERSYKYVSGKLMVSQAFTPSEWWTSDKWPNKYAAFVGKRNQKIATHILGGLVDFTKRLLPTINYNYILFPKICDNLNDFAEYAIVFHNVACGIKKDMQKGKFNGPIQIDYWIIPQKTERKGGIGTNNDEKMTPFNVGELNNRNNINLNFASEAEPMYLDLGEIEQILTHPRCGYIKGEIIKEPHYDSLPKRYRNAIKPDFFMTEVCEDILDMDFASNFRKMIKSYHGWQQRGNRYVFIIDRRHPKNKTNPDMPQPVVYDKSQKEWKDKIYMIAPKEYRCDNKQCLCICGETLIKRQIPIEIKCSYCGNDETQEYEQTRIESRWMWTCQKKVAIHKNGYNLCIDTCNKQPLCICGAKLRCVVRLNSNVSRHAKCKWCDEELEANTVWVCSKGKNEVHSDGYWLCSIDCERSRIDSCGKLSEEWESVPESCLGLSKSYMLLNHAKNDKIPITMDHPLNGYMFGLSYHILREDNISVYWYHAAGGTYFELGDIKYGWPQWFETVDGKMQQFDEYTSPHLISKDNKLAEERLRNVDFEEFEKQYNTLVI